MSVPHSSMRAKRSAAMVPSMREASVAGVLRPSSAVASGTIDVGVDIDGADAASADHDLAFFGRGRGLGVQMFIHEMAAGENDSGVFQELAAIGHVKILPVQCISFGNVG